MVAKRICTLLLQINLTCLSSCFQKIISLIDQKSQWWQFSNFGLLAYKGIYIYIDIVVYVQPSKSLKKFWLVLEVFREATQPAHTTSFQRWNNVIVTSERFIEIETTLKWRHVYWLCVAPLGTPKDQTKYCLTILEIELLKNVLKCFYTKCVQNKKYCFRSYNTPQQTHHVIL